MTHFSHAPAGLVTVLLRGRRGLAKLACWPSWIKGSLASPRATMTLTAPMPSDVHTKSHIQSALFTELVTRADDAQA